ncbi:TadE family type IV pilus minor pilin [Nonomuraea sp. NPDC049714]|uniref:TadE family type IV pilus minor pilin n=2 Tax=unclassified Nonomuraea TaxID=2593643 RepID=UPI0037A1C57E
MTPHPTPLSKTTRRSTSRGSVTAETAAMLPALMVVLAAALWAIQSVAVQLECVDAARVAARAAARGESLDEVRALVRAATGQKTQVNVSRTPEQTRIHISVEVRPPWGPTLPAVQVTASATAATES